MWFRSLFDSVLARSPCTPSRRRQRARSVRLLLEILEDRTLLSTFTVDALTDTGAGSGLTGDLRYCVTNATSGNDTITFAQGLTGTIYLQSALPTLNASVAIQGPGANLLTVLGAGFDVGSAADVQISGLTLSHADTAIVNNGTATVSDCTLSGNGGNPGDTIGGAISNYGNLTVNNSTISGNSVQGVPAYLTAATDPWANPAGNGMGGGIYMGGGTLTINSSTIANNEAIGGSSYDLSSPTIASLGAGYGLGGGLYIAGGTVSIDNSTIADNGASGGTYNGEGVNVVNSAGGGIFNNAGPSALQIYDTIIADNGDSSLSGPDLAGSVTSLGHNLIGNTSGGSGFAASDLLNVNPQLGPLQNNGGPTQTMALLPGSPAIDAGDNTNAPAYDQRGPGFARIVNGIIDIGAFEVQNGSSGQASSLTVAGFPSVITAGNAGSFTVTALNADSSIDTNYTGTVQFTSSDGQAVLPATYTFTAADAGVHTFSATLKTAGTQSITATDNFGLSASEAGITVNPAAASALSVSGFPSPTTAGVAGSFTVTLKDAYGNLASGYTGTVHFTSSDAKAMLPANYSFTAADAGVHTFSATLKTAGTQSITATDTTTSSLTGADGGITVKAAAASKFILLAPSKVNPGVPFSLTVIVEDAYGNVVTGYTGTIHFSSTDTRARLPANYTFTASDNGAHTFTGLVLRRIGNQKITITDTHNSSITGSALVDVL